MKCETCKYATFDDIWGEYKCKHFSRRVKTEECEQCKKYVKENTKKENK